MALDDILKLMESRVEKWMDVNQAREIIGTPKKGKNSMHKIDFYPRQISYNHKEITEIELISENGGLITEPGTSTTKDYRARIEARVGDLDNSKGRGVGHQWEEIDVPYKNMTAMIRTLDDYTDYVLKKAFNDYWKYHASLCEFDEDKFKKLSREEPVEFMEKEKNIEFDMNRLAKVLEKASDYIYRLGKNGEIEFSQVSATIQKINRRFVNIERTIENGTSKSRIFTSDTGANVVFEAKVRDKHDQIITYHDRIADLDISKVLDKHAIETACRAFAERVNSRIDCPVQESGLYPVIFNGGALGVLIHEGLAAHLLSAKYIEEHATTFKGKLGKQIIPSFISVYNDPSKEGVWGSYKYDEEGVKSQRIELVRNGILMDFLHDRSTAGRMNRQSNGCCRAENKKDNEDEQVVTEPRIGIIEVTTSKPESQKNLVSKLINICKKQGLEYGLLVEDAGGEVWPGTGEFSIYPRWVSRIYTDGRIVPVSRAYILGNPYNMLNDIITLDNSPIMRTGFCGADSGLVYTAEISPSALLTRVEVRQEEDDAVKKRLVPEKEE